LYGHTTNPVIATGDGIAMASRANAVIKEMEFIQFHPTALYDASTGTSFLISEAVRGFGAYLRTKNGHRFMPDYDSRGDLASRDIVSQSIDLELKKTGDDCVYLDCTHLDLDGFKKHFPMIYERCKSVGIDIAKDWIPVVPAQHYLCGGIVVDKNGKTSVENLFACGECSRTGLHGANRLASNSLLEALVYSDKIYHYLENHPFENGSVTGTVSDWEITSKPEINLDDVAKLKAALQLLMRQNAGIVRNDADLIKAKDQLLHWKNEVEEQIKSHNVSAELYELQNMITIGNLIVQQSIDRDENRGGLVKINPATAK
jgi:L-aspartate oxidase